MSLFNPTDNYPVIAADDLQRVYLRFGGIYQIRNILTNKIFVGSTVKFRTRRNTHFSHLAINKHHCPYLQHSWNKYGVERFVYEIIEFTELTGDSDIDKPTLLAREQHWLDRTQSYNPKYGYNANPIAGSPLGIKRSEETKAKHRNREPRIVSEETRRKISEGNKGIPKPQSAEHIANRVASRKANGKVQIRPPHSEETKAKMREAWGKRKERGAYGGFWPKGKKRGPYPEERRLAQKADEKTNARLRALAEAQRGKPTKLTGRPKTEEHKEALRKGWDKRRERLAAEKAETKNE